MSNIIGNDLSQFLKVAYIFCKQLLLLIVVYLKQINYNNRQGGRL